MINHLYWCALSTKDGDSDYDIGEVVVTYQSLAQRTWEEIF